MQITLDATTRLLTTDQEIKDSKIKSPLAKTDYWSKRAAGTLVFARGTGRFLLGKRSAEVSDPGTWSTFGGAMDRGESPPRTVRRELREEVGYHGDTSLIPLLEYKDFDRGCVYHNYLTIVPEEFTPVLNWETEAAEWFEYGEFPAPLHPGVEALLADKASTTIIQHNVNRRL